MIEFRLKNYIKLGIQFYHQIFQVIIVKSNFNILKSLSFLFLIFLLTLHNGYTQEWKKYAKALPALEKIEFTIQGEKLNLRDDIDVLCQYYINKETDTFLIEKIQTEFTSTLNKGLDLRKSKVKFSNFPKYKVPEDLSWDENPFNDRNWQWSLHQLSMIPYLLAGYDSF